MTSNGPTERSIDSQTTKSMIVMETGTEKPGKSTKGMSGTEKPYKSIETKAVTFEHSAMTDAISKPPSGSTETSLGPQQRTSPTEPEEPRTSPSPLTWK